MYIYGVIYLYIYGVIYIIYIVEVFLSFFSEPEIWCLPTHLFCTHRVDLQNIRICCTSVINHACCMSYRLPWINDYLFTKKTNYDILQYRFLHHFLPSFNYFLIKFSTIATKSTNTVQFNFEGNNLRFWVESLAHRFNMF